MAACWKHAACKGRWCRPLPHHSRSITTPIPAAPLDRHHHWHPGIATAIPAMNRHAQPPPPSHPDLAITVPVPPSPPPPAYRPGYPHYHRRTGQASPWPLPALSWPHRRHPGPIPTKVGLRPTHRCNRWLTYFIIIILFCHGLRSLKLTRCRWQLPV